MTRKAVLLILVLACTAVMSSPVVPGAEDPTALQLTEPSTQLECGPGFPACYATCQGLEWHDFLECFNNCVAIHCS